MIYYHMWSSYMVIIYMIMIYDHDIWWSCMMIIYDDHVWWSCMMIIYDDHKRWSYMMIIYADNVVEKLAIRFFTEMVGDLWGMFWHHHWCLKNYLDPLTINLKKNINKCKKTQNHRTVSFRYSNNSKVSPGADLYTFPFFMFLFVWIFAE